MSLVIAPWALLTVSAMWGISFVWMKDILDQQDVYSFLFTRFLLASIAMIILRPSVTRGLSKNILKKGTVTGFVLGAGYIFQTLGLDNTTPAITGFVILPNSVDMMDKPQNQVVVNPKLSPQMVEDLEMLMVLGEDKVKHGS